MTAIPVGLHFQNVRPLAGASIFDGFLAGFAYSRHVHAVHFFALDLERYAALVEFGFRRVAGDTGAHGVHIVLDYVYDRKVPE